MKKILIITPVLPYPLTNGGAQGVFHYIDKLRDEYEISLLCEVSDYNKDGYNKLVNIWSNVTFYPFISTAENSTNNTPTYSFAEKILLRITKKIQNTFFRKDQIKEESKTDYIRANSISSTFSRHTLAREFVNFVASIANKDFDVIQVEFAPYISLASILPNKVQKIFIHHELLYARAEIEMSLFQHVDKFDIYAFKQIKQFEISCLKLYDKIVAVSDIDQEKLRTEPELATKCIYSSPLMINRQDSIPCYKYKFNNKLTFVASVNHYPNVDGLNWFISEVWDKVLEKNNSLELHIIGAGWHPSIFTKKEELKNIYFHGYVENLDEFLMNSISIVPIRIGSGMRMKIIEAVNYKIPFITTSIGVEGLDFRHKIDCLIADSEEDLAHAITELAMNESLQLQLIKESEKTMNKSYNIDSLLSKRKAIYES